MSEPRIIWTVGHSTHDAAAFVQLLTSAGIQRVADVRRFPASRRQPHFCKDELRASLAAADIGYLHLPDLGGRRGEPAADSPNTGWRVASFAAYADYMNAPAFEAALSQLADAAAAAPTAMMCAEALPWRCHRRLIADAMIVRGWEVRDILSNATIEPHALTPFAKVEHGRLTYPPEQASLF